MLAYNYRQIEKGGNAMRERLKERRKSAGYTQSDMAGFLECTEQYYNLIENERRRPSPEKAQKIGKILRSEERRVGKEWGTQRRTEDDTARTNYQGGARARSH